MHYCLETFPLECMLFTSIVFGFVAECFFFLFVIIQYMLRMLLQIGCLHSPVIIAITILMTNLTQPSIFTNIKVSKWEKLLPFGLDLIYLQIRVFIFHGLVFILCCSDISFVRVRLQITVVSRVWVTWYFTFCFGWRNICAFIVWRLWNRWIIIFFWPWRSWCGRRIKIP